MLTCSKFVTWLNDLQVPAPVGELARMLDRLVVGPDDLDRYIHFDSDHYRRNPVAEGSHFQALVVCWRSGQRSPIHAHDGSAGGLKVISGAASEILYDVTVDPARPRPIARRRLRLGTVSASFDRDAHRIVATEGDLVTFHVYSPALRKMTIYPDETP